MNFDCLFMDLIITEVYCSNALLWCVLGVDHNGCVGFGFECIVCYCCLFDWIWVLPGLWVCIMLSGALLS